MVLLIRKLADIKAAKTSELVQFYNSQRAPIIKFRDRATAERRCADLLQKPTQKSSPKTIKPAPITCAPAPNMKTRMVIIRDHSSSMMRMCSPAMKDYNQFIADVARASATNGIDTYVSVIECGGTVSFKERQVPIEQLKSLISYQTIGATPLLQSLLEAITELKKSKDYNNPEVSFIVVATTDGQATDEAYAKDVLKKIRVLQNTDKWTFVFRVPRGYARVLIALGVDSGNILEWDQTERGMAHAAAQNDKALSDFYVNLRAGVQSTRTFYTSTADVTEKDVKKLSDISAHVSLYPVSDKEDDIAICEFVQGRLGSPMVKGAAFYQLVKTEDKIQEYKLIAIRDKDNGQIFCGQAARNLIGLPQYGNARVRPNITGKWQVFVQSTSVNRKVHSGTQLMYWPNFATHNFGMHN